MFSPSRIRADAHSHVVRPEPQPADRRAGGLQLPSNEAVLAALKKEFTGDLLLFGFPGFPSVGREEFFNLPADGTRLAIGPLEGCSGPYRFQMTSERKGETFSKDGILEHRDIALRAYAGFAGVADVSNELFLLLRTVQTAKAVRERGECADIASPADALALLYKICSMPVNLDEDGGQPLDLSDCVILESPRGGASGRTAHAVQSPGMQPRPLPDAMHARLPQSAVAPAAGGKRSLDVDLQTSEMPAWKKRPANTSDSNLHWFNEVLNFFNIDFNNAVDIANLGRGEQGLAPLNNYGFSAGGVYPHYLKPPKASKENLIHFDFWKDPEFTRDEPVQVRLYIYEAGKPRRESKAYELSLPLYRETREEMENRSLLYFARCIAELEITGQGIPKKGGVRAAVDSLKKRMGSTKLWRENGEVIHAALATFSPLVKAYVPKPVPVHAPGTVPASAWRFLRQPSYESVANPLAPLAALRIPSIAPDRVQPSQK